MTTVHDISLKVAGLVTDVLHGTATAGTNTSLTDSNALTQNNAYWGHGVLWIKSGTHAGKVVTVTGFSGNKLTFGSLGTAIAAGDRYAVARAVYPWEQYINAIQQALDETHITGDDNSLIGDGETLEFVLPDGVYDIKGVEFETPTDPYRGMVVSHHWKEKNGELKFDYGYAPRADDIIHVLYRDQHEELTGYATVISDEINERWLVYKAAEKLLIWGASQYGKNPEYLIEERMNIVLTANKGRLPRRDAPDFVMHTAGA